MSERITSDKLQRLVDTLNHVTGNPSATYRRVSNLGHVQQVAQVGNYHIDNGYGGYMLQQITTEAGGARDVLQCGRVSKSSLYELIHAYLQGYRVAAAPTGEQA